MSNLDLSGFRGAGKAEGVPGPPPTRPPAPTPPKPGPAEAATQDEQVKDDRASDATRSEASTPAAPRRSRKSSARRSTPQRPASKQRVVAHVALRVADATRRAADENDLYVADVVLDALARHSDEVRRELGAVERPPGPFAPAPSRRRRRVESATQLIFTLEPRALEALDAIADECGASRSAVVSAALEKHLLAD